MPPNEQNGFTTSESSLRPDEASILESLLALGIPASRILELGCRTGRLTRLLAETFPHALITAIDADSDALVAAARTCSNHAHRITFVHGDFTSNTDLHDAEFDLTLAVGVLAGYPMAVVRDILQRASATSTFVVGFDHDPVPPKSGTEPNFRHDFASLCHSIGLRSQVLFEQDRADWRSGRLILAWGGTDTALADDDPDVLPSARLDAEQFSQSLLAEGTPAYAYNDDLVAQLERSFSERARRPFLSTEGGPLLAPNARSSLRERLDQLEAELDQLAEAVERQELPSQIRQDLDGTIPAGAIVAVVSDGDETLLALGDREAWHFPQTVDGQHVGYSPADSAAAISLLDETRAKGADYLLLPSPAYWWMEHYRDFARHLVQHYRTIRPDAGDSLIFDLRAAPERQPLRHRA